MIEELGEEGGNVTEKRSSVTDICTALTLYKFAQHIVTLIGSAILSVMFSDIEKCKRVIFHC